MYRSFVVPENAWDECCFYSDCRYCNGTGKAYPECHHCFVVMKPGRIARISLEEAETLCINCWTDIMSDAMS